MACFLSRDRFRGKVVVGVKTFLDGLRVLSRCIIIDLRTDLPTLVVNLILASVAGGVLIVVTVSVRQHKLSKIHSFVELLKKFGLVRNLGGHTLRRDRLPKSGLCKLLSDLEARRFFYA